MNKTKCAFSLNLKYFNPPQTYAVEWLTNKIHHGTGKMSGQIMAKKEKKWTTNNSQQNSPHTKHKFIALAKRNKGLIFCRVYITPALNSSILNHTFSSMNSVLRLLPSRGLRVAPNKIHALHPSLKNWQSSSSVLAKFFSTEEKKHRNIGISAHIDRYVWKCTMCTRIA